MEYARKKNNIKEREQKKRTNIKKIENNDWHCIEFFADQTLPESKWPEQSYTTEC